MKVAIVTVDFNGHKDTIELLESAAKLEIKEFEVKTIVVDNGSSKPFSSRLEKDFKNINLEFLQTGTNLGFAGGYNFGMRYALSWGADYILIINNDTLFNDPEILSKLVKTLKNEKAGMVSPKINFAKGYEFYKDRYKKSDEGKVIWFAGGSFDESNVRSIHRGIDEIDTGKYDLTEETGFISGCCLLIKREVLEKVGFFNESLFAYFEDFDFVYRVKLKGFRLYYGGDTSIFHKVSRTAGIGSPITDYLLTRNRMYVGMKYMPRKTKFALLRESVKLFLAGRKEQRLGIKDYYLGKKGKPGFIKEDVSDKEFPLNLSVVIVNYKTKEMTLKLLETIFNKRSGFDKKTMEVVLLDNASEDGIGNDVAKKYPEVKFIQNEKNTGFAAGYNKAIYYTKGEFVLMLNSDMEVLPGSLSKLLTKAINSENCVIAGKLILGDGSTQKSCFNLPTVGRAFAEYFLGIKNSFSMFAPTKEQFVEGAVMACFLIPRKILNEVGYLSGESFMYFEDIEYCRRLKNVGIKIIYYPPAQFIHYHGASSKKIGEKAGEYLKKGSALYHGKLKYSLLSAVLWLGQKKNIILGK